MMIGRRPQPVIGKPAGVWGSGKSKGSKKYDLGGGVGLGIVAALEKNELVSHNYKQNKPIFITRNQTRPVYIPMEVQKNEEDYTYVTCHGPNKTKISTKVYCDGGQHYGAVKKGENICFDKKNEKNYGCCVFYISPATISDDFSDFPESDFLSHCHLCHKKLHDKDIYMYRGEKAFCSTECRCVQIAKDEQRDKKLISGVASSRSTANSADISTTPYDTTSNGLVFATRILAT